MYSIGVDSSEGIIHGDKIHLAALGVTQLPDFNAACVIDCETARQVATHRSLEPTSIFAEKVFALHALYNQGILVIEANGPGIAVLNKVEELGARNFYQRRAPDKYKNIFQVQKGFKTTTTTRANLIANTYDSILEEDGLILVSRQTIAEFKSFIKTRLGREEAAPGAKDDEVFAAMLALEGRRAYFRKEIVFESKYKGHPDQKVWEKMDRMIAARDAGVDEEEGPHDDDE